MTNVPLTSFEVIRCGDCGHERARPIAGQYVMPCARCGNTLLQVWALEPTLCGTVEAGGRSAGLHRAAA